ncbi:MAG: hypothetical protein Q9219_000990 [cf. Caloplaca sp. 3 TL-2023]
MENSTAKRSSSRNRPASRPTTPLRPSSRTSLRESQTFAASGSTSSQFPLDSLEPAFAELSDSMADLEANFMHLQLMHESLSRFNENFASFLYGLNMNAFCVDFPESLTSADNDKAQPESEPSAGQENDATFLTTDTSFFDKPASAKKPSKYTAPTSSTSRSSSALGRRGMNASASARGSRGNSRGTRASGIARGRFRGAR